MKTVETKFIYLQLRLVTEWLAIRAEYGSDHCPEK
jgi:hypothetical protein